jgi:hypothetical protein
MWRIERRDRDGVTAPVYEPTGRLSSCARLMEAITAGNARDALTLARQGKSYTASNSRGQFFTMYWSIKP